MNLSQWAKIKEYSSAKGHAEGLETLRTFLKSYDDLRKEHNIAHYIFYAFSTENWNRDTEEVDALLALFGQGLDEVVKELERQANPPCIRFIGDLNRFSSSLQEKMKQIESKTIDNNGTVAFALSYGGRDEIVRAAAKAVSHSESGIQEALDTNDIPDPDLIIRTGGERRLSNFLLWQAAYSELFFLDVLWPDFTKDMLVECVEAFHTRERRHGL